MVPEFKNNPATVRLAGSTTRDLIGSLNDFAWRTATELFFILLGDIGPIPKMSKFSELDGKYNESVTLTAQPG
jgi:hypothetical protein